MLTTWITRLRAFTLKSTKRAKHTLVATGSTMGGSHRHHEPSVTLYAMSGVSYRFDTSDVA